MIVIGFVRRVAAFPITIMGAGGHDHAARPADLPDLVGPAIMVAFVTIAWSGE